jgi:hypothetical protein
VLSRLRRSGLGGRSYPAFAAGGTAGSGKRSCHPPGKSEPRAAAEVVIGEDLHAPGGVQQVRVVLRALALRQLAAGAAAPQVAQSVSLTAKAIRELAHRYNSAGPVYTISFPADPTSCVRSSAGVSATTRPPTSSSTPLPMAGFASPSSPGPPRPFASAATGARKCGLDNAAARRTAVIHVTGNPSMSAAADSRASPR